MLVRAPVNHMSWIADSAERLKSVFNRYVIEHFDGIVSFIGTS